MNNVAIYAVTPEEGDKQKYIVAAAAKSLKWSLLYNVAPRLFTPFSTMTLAALLTPADFGLVAISSFLIALATIIGELGMGRTVIQQQTDVQEAASVSMWLSLMTTSCIYLILWTSAPSISTFYSNFKVTQIVRVAALSLPLASLTAVPKAILRRNMNFNALFRVNTSFLMVTAVASVILAFLGLGAWAVIIGQLIGMITSSIMVWAAVDWRPSLVINWAVAGSLLKFSAWIMLSNAQNWCFLYADNAIAGFFLGIHSLGIYSLGFNIATVIPTFIILSLSDVAYPSFCKLERDNHEIGRGLLSLQRLAAAVLFPVSMGLSAIAEPAVQLLYGNKWQGLGFVIAVLVIMPGLSNIWALNEHAYTSLRRPDIYPKLSGLSLLVLLPLLWLTAPYGLHTFTIARSIGALCLPIANILIGAKIFKVSVSSQLRSFGPPLGAAFLMYMSVSLLCLWLSPFSGAIGWLKLIMIIAAGLVTYGCLIWGTDKALWLSLNLSLKRIAAR